jgi:predicted transcriptional regulator YdeE
MLKPYIVQKDILRIIGKRLQIGPGPEKGKIGVLWASYGDIMNNIPNRVDSLFFGISIDFWHPNRESESGEEGLRSYMIGAEVSSLTQLPFDLESRVIPASSWVYVPIDYNDPDVKVLAPDELKSDFGYLTGSVFGWTNKWLKDNGYERQDFPDELEIYGLDNGGQCTLAIAIK